MQPETSRIASFNDTSSVFVWVLPKSGGKKFTGWVGCSQRRVALLRLMIRLVFLCGCFGTRQGYNTQLV